MDKNDKYLHRELSWLEFNRRVLEEAKDEAVPLLERVKFLAIFSSNLDDFSWFECRESNARPGKPLIVLRRLPAYSCSLTIAAC